MAQPQAKLEFVEEFLSLSRHAIAEAISPEVDADKAEALAPGKALAASWHPPPSLPLTLALPGYPRAQDGPHGPRRKPNKT